MATRKGKAMCVWGVGEVTYNVIVECVVKAVSRQPVLQAQAGRITQVWSRTLTSRHKVNARELPNQSLSQERRSNQVTGKQTGWAEKQKPNT